MFFCHLADVACGSFELTVCTFLVLKEEGFPVFAVFMQLALTHPYSLKSVHATVSIHY